MKFELFKKKPKDNGIDIGREISLFKRKLLMSMAFYGDILSYVEFKEDNSFSTAATNGKVIVYNKYYMQGLSEGERNFVIMHEFMHVLLLHFKRNNERFPEIWNLAADYVVNGILTELSSAFGRAQIPFTIKEDSCFLSDYTNQSVEEIYYDVCSNPGKYEKDRQFINRDLFVMDCLSKMDEDAFLERLKSAIAKAKERWGCGGATYSIPSCILSLVETKKLNWKKLLKRYLSQMDKEDISYNTPERKYLHMDMILPGCGRMEEQELGELWLFIDSSGSISDKEINQFITQAYRIANEFKSIINIVYWHTEISDVYLNIRKKEELLTCVPSMSGGTDPTCIYKFITKNNISPSPLIILTDGFFYPIDEALIGDLYKKTILVISADGNTTDSLSYMGKVAALY